MERAVDGSQVVAEELLLPINSRSTALFGIDFAFVLPKVLLPGTVLMALLLTLTPSSAPPLLSAPRTKGDSAAPASWPPLSLA